MENTNILLEVDQTCSALSRPHASPRSGVVSADISAQYQGTGLPIGGFGTFVVDAPATTKVRMVGLSGTTTWSPPV